MHFTLPTNILLMIGEALSSTGTLFGANNNDTERVILYCVAWFRATPFGAFDNVAKLCGDRSPRTVRSIAPLEIRR